MEEITHAVMEATKAVVQAIMAERGDETFRHRSEEEGMRPMLCRPSPTFNFTEIVKSVCKTHHVDQAERNACFEEISM